MGTLYQRNIRSVDAQACCNMSEKLCLQWNDFQENVNSAFGSLREDNEFADVTLACEDGQQIEAHKVILAASSPFFQSLLKRNRHPHPLIYMRGIKSENLLAIVDFLYCGEANVFQENLDSFLAIAEELKLKGLMGQTKSEKQMQNVQMKDERRISIQHFVNGDLQDFDAKVKSMKETSTNLIPSGKERAKICKMCGKEGQAGNIRDHIEANHLEGVSLPCNVCGKEFRSRNLLRRHTCSPKVD